MGFSSFYAGLSGLQAYSLHLNVIGNNLANINTVGYKTSRVTFQDLLYQSSFGSSRNPNQIGLGVQTSSVDPNYTQGSLQSTGFVTDLAIQGNGFFVVREPSGALNFTRAGNFSPDQNGNLATSTGAQIQGYTQRDAQGNIVTSGSLSNIVIPPGLTASPQQTGTFALRANLDAGAAVDDPLTGANEAASYSTTLTVYDSLGAKHDLTINLVPVDTNADGALDQWDYDVTVPGDEVTGGTPGTPFSIATGTLTFDAAGQLTSGGTVSINVPAWLNGSAAQTIDWNLSDPAGNGLITGFAGPSSTSNVTQNGYSAGTLRSLTISNDGAVDGVFTNGTTIHLARIALATFNNPNGLLKVGFNNLLEATASGAATIGAANSGGRGAIASGALELSNVDITQELTDMITAERGYQANSRIITTTDQIIQEALNLKR